MAVLNDDESTLPQSRLILSAEEACEDVAGFPHNLARAMGSYGKSIGLRTV
jgi:hypothetical protein